MSTKSDPASTGVAVTKSDSTVLKPGCVAFYIGGTGDVAIESIEDGTPVVYKAVPVGILPVGGVRVRSTATTATDIVALYN